VAGAGDEGVAFAIHFGFDWRRNLVDFSGLVLAVASLEKG